jgi:hypothetical protein
MSVWVAGATVVAGVAGAAISSNGAKNAANTQAGAANAATALQQGIYNDTVQRNQPYVQGGQTAFNALLGRLGLAGADGSAASGYGSFKTPTAEEVMAQPGYQFGLEQGQNALNRQLNARGMSYSGAQLKAANMFGNNYATGQYQNAFNNLQSSNQQAYTQLMGAAGLGQASANNTASAGQQFGAQAGQNMTGAANAQGAAQIASGNAWGNVLNQGVSAYKNASGGGGGGEYTSPNIFGNYSNPSGSTYDYRGGYLDNSLRGGG